MTQFCFPNAILFVLIISSCMRNKMPEHGRSETSHYDGWDHRSDDNNNSEGFTTLFALVSFADWYIARQKETAPQKGRSRKILIANYLDILVSCLSVSRLARIVFFCASRVPAFVVLLWEMMTLSSLVTNNLFSLFKRSIYFPLLFLNNERKCKGLSLNIDSER